MLFTLPDPDTLYTALSNRDPTYEGRAFVGVRSTGIFCRLTCPARTPLRQNCTFYETVKECFEAGYRPCKRCHPLGPAAEHDPMVQRLIKALSEAPDKRWLESDIKALGFDPSTVRRSFKRNYGITFLEMSRQLRLREGFSTLSSGKRVIDAQIDAGFESGSAFRKAFQKRFGISPTMPTKDALMWLDWIETPLGSLIVLADAERVHLLEFLDRRALPHELKKMFVQSNGCIGFGRTQVMDQLQRQLESYFNGTVQSFDIPLCYHGSHFTTSVWRELLNIPAGETRSYSEIAQKLGRATAVRAVARANGANQIAILIPCHRVIGADGSLTGYGGGLWRKQKLLEIERQYQGG